MDTGQLGKKIRSLRTRQSLTLVQLSKRSGVGPSMISEIERGNKTPTVTTLANIAEALDVTVSSLLGERVRSEVLVTRQAERQILVEEGTGIRRQLLAPAFQQRGVEVLEYLLPPGTAAGPFLAQPAGTAHHITVIEQTLQVQLDEDVHMLSAGDSISYAADTRHTYTNQGASPCRFLLIMDRNRR